MTNSGERKSESGSAGPTTTRLVARRRGTVAARNGVGETGSRERWGFVVDDRQAVIDKLAKESKLGMGTGGEVKELSKILWTDEQPMKIARGTYNGGNGILVATDRRLIFIDKGLIGLKTEDFAYDKISSIQMKTGMVFGEIEIDAAGNRSKIQNMDKKIARELADWIRNHIGAAARSVAPPTAAAADPIEQIARLAKLKDAGAITEEEFSAKKKQLLGL